MYLLIIYYYENLNPENLIKTHFEKEIFDNIKQWFNQFKKIESKRLNSDNLNFDEEESMLITNYSNTLLQIVQKYKSCFDELI